MRPPVPAALAAVIVALGLAALLRSATPERVSRPTAVAARIHDQPLGGVAGLLLAGLASALAVGCLLVLAAAPSPRHRLAHPVPGVDQPPSQGGHTVAP
jgi:hypothetical protein